jgi:hypothetical protein
MSALYAAAIAVDLAVLGAYIILPGLLLVGVYLPPVLVMGVLLSALPALLAGAWLRAGMAPGRARKALVICCSLMLAEMGCGWVVSLGHPERPAVPDREIVDMWLSDGNQTMQAQVRELKREGLSPFEIVNKIAGQDRVDEPGY